MSKALFVFVFVFALAAVECSEIGVAFSGLGFTMTCPIQGEATKWTSGQKTIETHENTLQLTYDDTTKGQHNCRSVIPDPDVQSGSSVHYFYVQGKVCKNCYELDGALLMGFIFVDLLVTGGIITVIYTCARKKSASAPSPAPASGRTARGSAPSVPDRDYEPLNLATRDTGTYAVAGVNRTG
ncbi:hypothetical protein SKAU_G00090640 [Synaphobranchus kaupii]|uniref:CD3 gamma/delta subunit Ig-like domain-containing protein n=1 Tax=Synaphobranchus kaupii TaxID=118154 RepID=A0A9Q1FXH8_SYNKA|nr:hypothetical protein SKAU_G00090640 [Synaphobranchus kaupii]